MEFKKYSDEANKTDISDNSLDFYLAGMVEELGEVAGYIKRLHRGDYESLDDVKHDITLELGDQMWYFIGFCKKLNIDPNEVLRQNLIKVNRRYEEGKIKGSGSRR